MIPLHEGWQLARLPAGACIGPDDLSFATCDWQRAIVPGTVAMSVHHDLDAPGLFDADDWWYQLRFENQPQEPGNRHVLRLDGLATVAEAWLNGDQILTSQNMFLGHRIDVTGLMRSQNLIVIVFRSLQAAKVAVRPRPRWKTALVDQQNLRWFRTTLLGRMPGCTPPINPVGPWAPIGLETIDKVELATLNLQASVAHGAGRLILHATLKLHGGGKLENASLRLGDAVHPLEYDPDGNTTIRGDLTIPEAPLWWPHTHGQPTLVSWALEVQVDGNMHALDQGAVGFKSIRLDNPDSSLQFIVNDVSVFCRGACWITNDFISLRGNSGALRKKLELAQAAGLNMLRVSGTATYESAEFYSICDELGILVWQDFMFANMDYPVADEAFRLGIESEVCYQLNRLSRHACIAAYCGGSEIAQQAAMLGLPAEQWLNDFFGNALPEFCGARHAGIPYFPSSPYGGALPFHVGSGIAHYYGVGAYRRPLTDAKTARVKFATECLGFSNVPEQETMDLIHAGKTLPPHHPRWKARQPRDNGAGWDFEDIRDHYFRVLFGSDPIELRSHDIERYYAISRVVSGEVMQRVFSEWRNPANECSGALVWFFADLWPGAGWGIVDSTGRPKAAYWFLKRSWTVQALRFTDEGLDGLNLHLINEEDTQLDALVEFELLQNGKSVSASANANVRIPARGAVTLQGDALLGHFSDSTCAYRFGPPKHDVVTARLIRGETHEVLSEDFYFPCGMNLPMQRNPSIQAHAEWRTGRTVLVTLQSDVFLQSVSATCDGFAPDDNYFHLVPNQKKTIIFSASDTVPTRFRTSFNALNLVDSVNVFAEQNEKFLDGEL